jgi:hypothetical protein
MAKYDETLERMQYLMGYDNTLNESKKQINTGIEYHTTAADGKEYGIIKEGRRFYIKTTTPEKKNIAESYDYINGYNYRNENGYNSYNEATKQLELRLMSINESLGKHEDVTVANLNKTKEALAILTEDARKELDRMHAIFENSFISKNNIGDHGNPEGKGTATGANTKENNDPFSLEAKPNMTFKGEEGNVEKSTEHENPGDPDKKLQNADKMEKGPRGDEGYKDTHDDLDGKGVADQKKSGAKAVKMNEGMFEGGDVDMDALSVEDDPNNLGEFNGDVIDQNPDDFHADDIDVHADDMASLEGDDNIFGDDVESLDQPEQAGENGLVGMGDEESNDYDLDSLLEEFMNEPVSEPAPAAEPAAEPSLEEHIEVLDGPNGGDNGIKGNDAPGDGKETMARMKPVNEDEQNHEPEGAGEKESKIVGPDKVMDGPHGGDNGIKGNDAKGDGKETMARMDEEKLQKAIDRIAEAVCQQLKPKKSAKDKLQEAIDRIVAEEVTKLDAWGKHPRFRKEPMSTPANKEVLAGTAKGDWNDDSTKGEQPYGLKIGDGKPFDKIVDMLTDQVLANLKESLRAGKK